MTRSFTMKNLVRKSLTIAVFLVLGVPMIAMALTVGGKLDTEGGGWGRFATTGPIKQDVFSVNVTPQGAVSNCYLTIDSFKVELRPGPHGNAACNDALEPILARASTEVLKCQPDGVVVNVDYGEQSADCPPP
jgi:hypothetical protein